MSESRYKKRMKDVISIKYWSQTTQNIMAAKSFALLIVLACLICLSLVVARPREINAHEVVLSDSISGCLNHDYGVAKTVVCPVTPRQQCGYVSVKIGKLVNVDVGVCKRGSGKTENFCRLLSMKCEKSAC